MYIASHASFVGSTQQPTVAKIHKINCSSPLSYCKTNSNLTDVPTDTIPIDTEKIDLSNNSIVNLDNDSFTGLINVKQIDLNGNNLSSIPPLRLS